MDISRLQKAVTSIVLTASSRLFVAASEVFRMERLLAQAEYMAAQGVKELILVAQETTVYGTDLYGKKTLHILLQEALSDQGNPLDTCSLLLSGGDL